MTQVPTPVGYLVQGDSFVLETSDAEVKPLLIKNGPMIYLNQWRQSLPKMYLNNDTSTGLKIVSDNDNKAKQVFK
jgi:hypothetical protein